MLTPDKIKAKEFQTTGRGSYRAEDVDAFLDEIYASYDQAFRENGEIIKKMSILANKVEEYKKDEDSLRQALLSAQKLADKIVSDAKQSVATELSGAKAEAEKIVSDAKAKADKLTADAKVTADKTIFDAKKEADDIIGNVNRKVTQETLVFEMLQKEVSAFKNKMMDMYKEHLTMLDRLPSVVEEQDDAVQEKAPVTPVTEETAEEEPTVTEEVAEEAPAVEEVAEEPAEQTAQEDTEEEAFSLSGLDSIDDTEEILEDTDTYEDVVSESDDDKFVVDSSMFDEEDAFEDISSEKDEEPALDGFSLNVSDVELEDDFADVEPTVTPAAYAPADAEVADDDDDDDGAISFKSFFKKK